MPGQTIGLEAEAVVKQMLMDLAKDTHLDKIYALGELEKYPDLLVQSEDSKHAYLFEVKDDFRRIKPDHSLTYGSIDDAKQICRKAWTRKRFPLRGTGRTVRKGTSTVWQVDHLTIHKSAVKALIGTYPSYDVAAWSKIVRKFGTNLIWSGHAIIPPSLVQAQDSACQDKTLDTLRSELKQFLLSNEK